MEAQPPQFELEVNLCEIDNETSMIHGRCEGTPRLRHSVLQRHQMHGKRRERELGRGWGLSRMTQTALVEVSL